MKNKTDSDSDFEARFFFQINALTVKIGFIQDLRFDDLLDDVFQGDQSQHLVEGISLPLVVHLLDDGQVGLTWGQDMSITW